MRAATLVTMSRSECYAAREGIQNSGVTTMLKSLITALAVGAFAMTGIAVQAQAQYRPQCSNAPKNYIPCPLTPQGPQLPQPKGK
jgi:hypothetical protein